MCRNVSNPLLSWFPNLTVGEEWRAVASRSGTRPDSGARASTTGFTLRSLQPGGLGAGGQAPALQAEIIRPGLAAPGDSSAPRSCTDLGSPAPPGIEAAIKGGGLSRSKQRIAPTGLALLGCWPAANQASFGRFFGRLRGWERAMGLPHHLVRSSE